MNFTHTLEEDQLFADMFNLKDHPLEFDQQSEDSLFKQMVDHIVSDSASKFEADVKSLDQNEPNLQCDQLDLHHSIDEHSCFNLPDLERKEDPITRENSKMTVEGPQAQQEAKVFKISVCDKKASECDPPTKIAQMSQIDKEDEDNQTELDQNEVRCMKDSSSEKPSKRLRKDVTYKTILRKCRKYYQTRFNDVTGYLKSKKKEPSTFYRACILRFLEGDFQFDTRMNVSFHLGCLLYPQEMVRGIESFVYPDGVKTFTPKKVVKRKIETHKQQVDKLHSILYKFTHEKLDKFIAVPELAAIFMNFIQYGAGADVEDEEFREEYEDLTKRWKKTLAKSKKIKGVATLFN